MRTIACRAAVWHAIARCGVLWCAGVRAGLEHFVDGDRGRHGAVVEHACVHLQQAGELLLDMLDLLHEAHEEAAAGAQQQHGAADHARARVQVRVLADRGLCRKKLEC